MLRLGPAVWLATGSWIGLAPVAPGTFGSLLGLPLAWGIACIPSVWGQAGVLIALFAVGAPVCTVAARRMGGLKDPGAIVFDEILGMAITLFMIPLDPPRAVVFLAGFLLFRLFDVTKPPPIGRLERLPNGLGIMADDCLAGVFANLCLRLILWSEIL
ncbi:MAG TPA: phosphatidylglycerophosphatase A [Pirellulales bacterium]